MSTVVASLFVAFLSVAIRHVGGLHGSFLAAMTRLVASEIALMQQVLAHGPQTALSGLVLCFRNQ